MKKKISMALAALLVAAVVLSVTAHGAEPPQAVIGSGGGETAISITDITPREDSVKEGKEDETKDYKVGSCWSRPSLCRRVQTPRRSSRGI